MTTTLPITDDITLVAFAPEHLDGAYRLSQIAQWPHRVEDWALNLSVSKGVVALRKDEVVGTALCSILGDVATFNMIIVDERLRGRGLGRKLMAKLFEAGEARELRLVATTDGLPLYQKLGFQATGEIMQHQGLVQRADPAQPVEIVSGTAIRAEVDTLAKFDAAATGMTRLDLLQEIAGQDPQNTALFKTNGGYALLRRFGRGLVLGPVLAAGPTEAKSLIAAAACHAEGRFLRLDLPKELGLSDFAESLGLAHAGGGTVMIAQPNSEHHTQPDLKTYALVSQALG